MNDDDHVREIRNALLAITDAEKKIIPLYDSYQAAVLEARKAGLMVTEHKGELGEPPPQPTITRVIKY